MSELEDLVRQLRQFRDERDWEQYHTVKNLASSLCIEAAELLEIVQWTEGEAAEAEAHRRRDDAEAELADIAIYLLLLTDRLDVDLISAIKQKIQRNNEKYPVEKARGRSTKYTHL